LSLQPYEKENGHELHRRTKRPKVPWHELPMPVSQDTDNLVGLEVEEGEGMREKPSGAYEVCQCGDYRHQHEKSKGKCLMPNNITHGYEECLKFRPVPTGKKRKGGR